VSDRIFAQPNTITGSIGVVSIIPNFQGLAERFSINSEQVKTGRHADIFSLSRPRDEESLAILQDLIDDTYEKFIDRVAKNRGMSREAVKELAGGRVWSGTDALASGLVDEIGGLDAAIADAAKRAGIANYSIIDRPVPEDVLAEFFKRLAGEETPMSSRGPARELRRSAGGILSLVDTLNDPGNTYARLPFMLELN
jgi:protease-4